MIKAAILTCFLCAAVTGTVLWVKAHAGNQAPAATVGITPTLIPWYWELHANAHLEGLPVLPEANHSDPRTIGSGTSTQESAFRSHKCVTHQQYGTPLTPDRRVSQARLERSLANPAPTVCS
jgi:hypothetical protein